MGEKAIYKDFNKAVERLLSHEQSKMDGPVPQTIGSKRLEGFIVQIKRRVVEQDMQYKLVIETRERPDLRLGKCEISQ